MVTMDFQQTGTVATFGAVQSCSPNAVASGGSGPKAVMATIGGSAGATQLFTVNGGSTRSTLMFQMAPGVALWQAGNIVLPIVIPGAGVNANLTIVRADACRRTSGNVAVGTYGHGLFLFSLSSSGTKTLTIPVSESIGASTDVLYVVVSIQNSSGSAQSSRFTPNALITTPIMVPEIEMRTTRLRAEISAKKTLERTVSPLALPEVVPNALLHDWSKPLELETAWLTDVVESAETEVEERTILRSRPIRTMRAAWTGTDRNHSSKILGNLARQQHSRLPIPLYCDQSPLTSAYTSGTSLACDTTHRRFYKGGRVAVGMPNAGILEEVEYAIIESIDEDALTLTGALAQAHALGSIVLPCLDVEKKLSQLAPLATDHHATVSLDCTEVTGASALPASAEPSLDDIEVIHNGIPVWVFPHNWSAILQGGIQRLGESISLGVGKFVALRGRRPRFVFPFKVSWFDRESFWKVINFFDSRRGRGRTFILANPQTLYKPVSVNPTVIEVEAAGNFQDHEEFFDKIIIELFDGTLLIRDIDTIDDLGAVWEINLSSALESVPSLDQVKRITSGHLVRMVQDVMKETWFSDKHGETTLAVIDIPDEKSVIVEGLFEPSYFDANINLSSLFLWADANRNVSKITGTASVFTRTGLINGADELPAQIIDDTRLNVPEIYSRGLIFPEPYLMPNGSALADMPILIRPDKWKTNKGRDCTETLDNSGHWKLQYQNGAKWWNDSLGMTLWWVGRLPVDNFVDDGFLFSDFKAAIVGFYWGHDKVRLDAFNLNYTSIKLKSIKIYTMRWNPGISIHVWRNGKLMASTFSSVPSSCSAGGQSTQIWSAESTTLDTSVGKDNKIGQHGYFSCCLMFTEALSVVSMNLVGEYLANLYTKDWKQIVI